MPFTVPGSGLAIAVKTGLMAVPASMLANCASDQKPSAAVAPAPVASVPASGMRTYLFRSGQNFAEVYAKVDPERMMRDVPPDMTLSCTGNQDPCREYSNRREV